METGRGEERDGTHMANWFPPTQGWATESEPHPQRIQAVCANVCPIPGKTSQKNIPRGGGLWKRNNRQWDQKL